MIPVCHCGGQAGSVILCLTRVRVTSGAPGLRNKGQALAIAEVAAAAKVIKISVISRALRHAACDELAFGAARPPEASFFFGI